MVGPIFARERQIIDAHYPGFDRMTDKQQQAILGNIRQRAASTEKFRQEQAKARSKKPKKSQNPRPEGTEKPQKPIPRYSKSPNPKQRRPKPRRTASDRKRKHW